MDPTQGMSTCTYAVHLRESSLAAIQTLSAEILTHIQSLAAGYIWHKQAFNLQPAPLASTAAAQTSYCLKGSVNCTDCVDDEWFTVHLLCEITRRWPDAVVSVEDEDGEFMLIEAAEVLPKWVTPGNAANRVWIHQQRLHLVPLSHTSSIPFPSTTAFSEEEEGFIDSAAAIELVRDTALDTFAPADLEAIVWDRIKGYPDKIAEHLHNTLAYLPVGVALALQDDPTLISEAIAAFYERDPASLRACNLMARFPPSSPGDAFKAVAATTGATPLAALPSTVFTPVVLTRPLYSQLVLQRFYAPKVFEKAGWNMGNSYKAGEGREEEERRRSVGLKIACGFEMLHSRTIPEPTTATGEFDATHPDYQKFLARLVGQDFFEGEIQGSQKWNEKETLAREGWRASRSDGSKPSFAQRVDEAIERSLAHPAPLPRAVTAPLPLAEASALESSEAFLTLDEQNFEEMLRSRGPGTGGLDDLEGFGEGEGYDEAMGRDEEGAPDDDEQREAREIARKLQGMAGKVEEFVLGEGALAGAEFEDEVSDDEDDSDEEEMVLSHEERAARTAALVAPIDPETWGHKTAPPPLAVPVTPSIPLPSRAPKLTEEKYDGASSDSSDEEEAASEDKVLDDEMGEGMDTEGGDENAPAVVEELEMDMEEEMDEFLKFATETLGLTSEQYAAILGERRGRGAFVPPPPRPKKTNQVPSASTPKAAPKPAPEPPVRAPLRNPNLTDFDALMEQMDSELAKTRTPVPLTTSKAPVGASTKPAPKAKLNPRGKPSAVVESSSEDEDDSGGEMDEELAALFKSAGGVGEGGEGTMDYNLVKNFLESFQSQGGFGGPAGNLSGRLGYALPRDGGGDSEQ